MNNGITAKRYYSQTGKPWNRKTGKHGFLCASVPLWLKRVSKEWNSKIQKTGYKF